MTRAKLVILNFMNNHFAAFVDDLKEAHGENLASVILYGAAAAGDFIPVESGYNILIALHKITPGDLRNAHATVREWLKAGNPLPVYFTVSELENAADVFPIEFHQMDSARKVLYGTDVLSGLEISDKFLRHQTEYELRSKVVRLRREYIPASGSVEGMKNLMSHSLTGFAALFHAVLLLHGVQPATSSREVVALTVRHLNIDGLPFEKIFNIRENNYTETLDDSSANDLFAEYMEQIENVINAVDAIGNK